MSRIDRNIERILRDNPHMTRAEAVLASSPFELTKEGDFYLAVNPAQTNEMISDFMSRNMNKDLMKICQYWYKPTPKPIQPELEMGSDDGTRTLMRLETTELIGKW